MIIAFPAARVVNAVPERLTTEESEIVQEPFWFVALEGAITGVSVKVSPTSYEPLPDANDTPVTVTVVGVTLAAVTVRLYAAVYPPSVVVNVIVAFPAARAVNVVPERLTTEESEIVQVPFLFVALNLILKVEEHRRVDGAALPSVN